MKATIKLTGLMLAALIAPCIIVFAALATGCKPKQQAATETPIETQAASEAALSQGVRELHPRLGWVFKDDEMAGYSKMMNTSIKADRITASSFLESNSRTLSYKPENIHDADFQSAWVEGVEGDGIGEYIALHFGNATPEIRKVVIANGYVHTEKTYRENSRPKKLKMYIDDNPFAVLNLEDKRQEQIFTFEPILIAGRTLKFEILEVYSGDLYYDMSISEIYFEELAAGGGVASSADFDISGTTLVKYIGNGGSVVIPNGITHIGDHAFEMKQLTGVSIPNTVISIGDWAFDDNQLTSLTIPDSVTHIGEWAFRGNQLTSLTIPNSITSISSFSFCNNQLTSVTIPNTVTKIGEYALSGNQLTGIIIPDSVTSIGNDAFSHNQLTSFTLPKGATSIGSSVFSSNQLTSVTIPNGITSIGSMAFYSNPMTSLSIPNSVTSIGSHAFWGNQLTSVTIPGSITIIRDSAFADNRLTSVTIPEGVTKIETAAFANNQLTSVAIPRSVTSIGGWAFAGNRLNGSAAIPNANAVEIGDHAFDNEPWVDDRP